MSAWKEMMCFNTEEERRKAEIDYANECRRQEAYDMEVEEYESIEKILEDY